MDLANFLEVGMFFLMSTIVIGGALGLVYMQRVAHSMMCLIFCFMGVAGDIHLNGCRILSSNSDSSLPSERYAGGPVWYHAY